MTRAGSATADPARVFVDKAVTDPSRYISGGVVQVRVKTGGGGSMVYDYYGDLVKITVTP